MNDEAAEYKKKRHTKSSQVGKKCRPCGVANYLHRVDTMRNNHAKSGNKPKACQRRQLFGPITWRHTTQPRSASDAATIRRLIHDDKLEIGQGDKPTLHSAFRCFAIAANV